MKLLATILLMSGICTAQLRPPAPSGGGAGTPGTSTNFPGNVIDFEGTNTWQWSTPSNAKTENGITTDANLTDAAGGLTNGLFSYNFGFSIPLGSSIDGILAEWKASTTTIDGSDGSNYLQALDSVFYADGGQNNSTLTPSLTYYSAGGSTDQWDRTWTPSDINSSAFSFVISIQDAGDAIGNLYSVDVMRVTIYYTTAGGGSGTRTLALGKPINGLRIQ